MTIPKHVIVSTLRTRNQDARADWVEKTLPDDVDPFLHSGLLSTLNLRVEDLVPAVTPTIGEDRTP
jgi:hypothetical protein